MPNGPYVINPSKLSIITGFNWAKFPEGYKRDAAYLFFRFCKDNCEDGKLHPNSKRHEKADMMWFNFEAEWTRGKPIIVPKDFRTIKRGETEIGTLVAAPRRGGDGYVVGFFCCGSRETPQIAQVTYDRALLGNWFYDPAVMDYYVVGT
ncbi:MAG: hypothetical protein FWH56_01625 [Betaproteobacteria bacterium]|nr:hypothetical protein [Betaproteobacteria bacterium]